jgi:putative peptide zinc metalloprotease protein
MLQLRPTFSESWYRVVGLKPKLRGTAQISRQYYRGERWYVVRDPAGNQFHRLSDAAYRFVGLLDGRRTVGEAWDLVGGQLADDAPTQPEVIQILSQLYAANLVETDIPPDATVLLRRHKQLVKRQLQGRLMNVLFPRIPIWDPDNFVKRWMPLARFIISKLGAVIWLIVVGWAIFALAPHWRDLVASFYDTIDLHTKPENIFLGFLTFVVIKFIHECGHAFSCRRFGGEVHEMGIMFLVFVPTPYVDASSAWSFPNKWKRMFVGAGGMIIEIFVAALCGFVWLQTFESGSIVSKFAFNAMLIASVTTVIFNANPLLRYDGYYMLSDFLEIPNLQNKSREYLLGLIKRHIFRIKSQQPLPPPVQRGWLFFYGIASSIYRVWVGLMIILMVMFQIPVLGVLMAIGGVVTWLCVPLFKLFKYLTVEPELHRKRGRAWAFTGAVAALVVVLVGIIQFPLRVRAEGILEPKEKAVLYARQAGKVKEVPADIHDGARLKKGDIIVVCTDPEMESKLVELKSTLAAARLREAAAKSSDNQAQGIVEHLTVQSTLKELADTQRRVDELTIRAPIDGYLVAPEIDQMPGRYFQMGEQVATVQETDELRVRGTVSQEDSQLLPLSIDYRQNKSMKPAEVRTVSDIGSVIFANSLTVIPGAKKDIPNPALTNVGGGDVQPDPHDQSGTKAANPEFELQVYLTNPDKNYIPGQRAYVRMTICKEPLMKQWARAVLQLIQARKEKGNDLAKY